MTSVSMLHFALSLSVLVLGAAACSDSDGDSTGSGGGGAGGDSTTNAVGSGGAGGTDPGSILGTTHDGECTTAADFAEACEAEGGVLGDNCQDASCGGPGWRATCYEPAPAPGADEFSCDGLFNCAAGEICRVFDPVADGCFDHACVAFPAACVDDPTCECLLAQAESSEDTCELDADGNPTLHARAF